MQNIGAADRTLRVLLGIIMFLLGIYFGSWWGLLGVIPLATAFTGWCPLYSLLGISTKKHPPKNI